MEDPNYNPYPEYIYVIQEEDYIGMKNTHATCCRYTAKAILRKIIFKELKYARENGKHIKINKSNIEKYIDGLTDENRGEYDWCSDYLEWVTIWCDIIKKE